MNAQGSLVSGEGVSSDKVPEKGPSEEITVPSSDPTLEKSEPVHDVVEPCKEPPKASGFRSAPALILLFLVVIVGIFFSTAFSRESESKDAVGNPNVTVYLPATDCNLEKVALTGEPMQVVEGSLTNQSTLSVFKRHYRATTAVAAAVAMIATVAVGIWMYLKYKPQINRELVLEEMGDNLEPQLTEDQDVEQSTGWSKKLIALVAVLYIINTIITILHAKKIFERDGTLSFSFIVSAFVNFCFLQHVCIVFVLIFSLISHRLLTALFGDNQKTIIVCQFLNTIINIPIMPLQISCYCRGIFKDDIKEFFKFWTLCGGDYKGMWYEGMPY